MTCIAAVETKAGVWMGCDSLTSYGWAVDVTNRSKIFKRQDFLMGVCGEVRISNLLEQTLDVRPRYENEGLDAYFVNACAEAIRELFKKTGCLTIENSKEDFRGKMLVAYRGRLFELNSDFAVVTGKTLGYCAAGSGEIVARGSLFSTRTIAKLSPKARVAMALKAAEHHVSSVRGPFRFYHQKRADK